MMPKRRLRVGSCALVGACLVALVSSGCSGRALRLSRPDDARPGRLRVMTLNVAHGRKLALQQALLRPATVEANLADIAAVLMREKPHLVALQEADGPSFWSGDFDHVATLARGGGFAHHFRGAHMDAAVGSKRLSYGTALLSRLPLRDPASHKFAPSLPTPTKGFVVATVTVPGTSGRQVTVVSVHLDFLRKAVRRRQVRTLAGILKRRKPPFVILGDMNCQWQGRDDSLRTLGKMLNVRAFEPDARHLPTFRSDRPRTRLDWILISPELQFRAYGLLPDKVSDHLAVVAEIGFK